MNFRKLHPISPPRPDDRFAAPSMDEQALEEIRSGMDQYGVLVFRDQPSRRRAARLRVGASTASCHTKTGLNAIAKKPLRQGSSHRHLQHRWTKAMSSRPRTAADSTRSATAVAHGRMFQDPPGQLFAAERQDHPVGEREYEVRRHGSAYEALPENARRRSRDWGAPFHRPRGRRARFEFARRNRSCQRRGAIHGAHQPPYRPQVALSRAHASMSSKAGAPRGAFPVGT